MNNAAPGEPGKTVALVTGSAKRIGAHIAARLALDGFGVVLHCRESSRSDAETTAADIKNAGGIAHIVCADLEDPEALPKLVSAAGKFGPLRLLVNNAALFQADDAKSFTPELFDRHFAVNLRAPILLSEEFARQMPKECEGGIVNIIDQRVLRPTPQYFTYHLSKSALWTATMTMAQAFAPQRIRVNAVGPGPVLPNDKDGLDGFHKEVAGVLFERAIEPDDIADAVIYLAHARNVTGQMISVDAGQHLGWRTPDIVE